MQTTNIDLADLTQKQGYPGAIAKMGDLAPAVSRAVVVVDNFLSQTGRETFKGENYTLQRNEDGDMKIGQFGCLMLIVALPYSVGLVRVKPMV